MIERRGLLTLGLGAMGFALLGGEEAAAKARRPIHHAVSRKSGHRAAPPRRLAFKHLHTGETFDDIYWEKGAYVTDALATLDKLLRDFRTEEVHPIAPALFDLLNAVRTSTGTHEPFRVISGFRSEATNNLLREQSAEAHGQTSEVAKRSLHMDGMAIDVRLPDVALTRLHRTARALKLGGVGYYPDSDFIHMDVGPVRYWQGT